MTTTTRLGFTLPVTSDPMYNLDSELARYYTQLDPYTGVNEYTTAQRTALTAIEGQLVYDTDLSKLFKYEDAAWVDTTVPTTTGAFLANANGASISSFTAITMLAHCEFNITNNRYISINFSAIFSVANNVNPTIKFHYKLGGAVVTTADTALYSGTFQNNRGTTHNVNFNYPWAYALGTDSISIGVSGTSGTACSSSLSWNFDILDNGSV